MLREEEELNEIDNVMRRKIITSLLVVFTFLTTLAQTPEKYNQTAPKPRGLTSMEIILYIVLPVIAIVVYFLYRRAKWKKHRKHRYPTNVFS